MVPFRCPRRWRGVAPSVSGVPTYAAAAGGMSSPAGTRLPLLTPEVGVEASMELTLCASCSSRGLRDVLLLAGVLPLIRAKRLMSLTRRLSGGPAGLGGSSRIAGSRPAAAAAACLVGLPFLSPPLRGEAAGPGLLLR